MYIIIPEGFCEEFLVYTADDHVAHIYCPPIVIVFLPIPIH